MTHLAVHAIGKTYADGTEALRGVDVHAASGEIVAILGGSGCGKTTLLRLIAGFAQAQTGQVLLDGRDVAPLPPWKRDVGMVFQSYALWPHMTVARNVAFGLEERRLPCMYRVHEEPDPTKLESLREVLDGH